MNCPKTNALRWMAINMHVAPMVWKEMENMENALCLSRGAHEVAERECKKLRLALTQVLDDWANENIIREDSRKQAEDALDGSTTEHDGLLFPNGTAKPIGGE